MVAHRNQMDLALGIAVGSSTQIALFVAPLLVMISWVIGRPMSLVFNAFELAGVVLSVRAAGAVNARRSRCGRARVRRR